MEQSVALEDDRFPHGREYWNKMNDYDNSYVSDAYESTMYIPYTKRIIEINFVGEDSKIITHESSEYFENPVEENKGNINQKYYFKFNDVRTFHTPGRHDRLKLNNNNSNEDAEYTITTNNHTYTELKNEQEMVSVIKVSVKDYLCDGIMRWQVDEIQSIECVPRNKIDTLEKRYPTEGAIPEWIDKL